MRRGRFSLIAGSLAIALAASATLGVALAQPVPTASVDGSSVTFEQALIDRYCVTCHNEKRLTGGLALESLDLAHVGEHAEIWEKVVRKLRGRLMPPIGRPRPDDGAYDQLASWLEAELDQAWAEQPNPGRTETFHRFNRAEYRNAIRDLLALEIDVDDFLPADDAGYGFDNIGGVLRMSQSLLERYLDASRVISRLAKIGRASCRERV